MSVVARYMYLATGKQLDCCHSNRQKKGVVHGYTNKI